MFLNFFRRCTFMNSTVVWQKAWSSANGRKRSNLPKNENIIDKPNLWGTMEQKLSGAEMTEPVRVGIIGVGQIGKAHVKRYQDCPEIDIRVIADVNEDEMNRVAAEFDIPRTTTNFRDILSDPDILAVDVCLHNNLHMPVTVAALEAGKHVYCEKPMAGSYIDARAMMEKARSSGQMLHIQLATLYSKECRAAKHLIDNDRLGRIYHARSIGHRRRGRCFVDGYGTPGFIQKKSSGGGALYDMGVYHIAQMMYLMGNPAVERITGKTYQEIPMDDKRKSEGQWDVEELGLGFVRFQDGSSLDIIEAWALHLDELGGSCIFGSHGGIRLNPFGFFHTQDDMEIDSTINFNTSVKRLKGFGEDENAYDDSPKHWVAALSGKVPLLPTAEVALSTMLISEGIYLSERLNREVTAEEVKEHSESTAIKI